MLFHLKYNGHRHTMLTSGQVKKILTREGLTVKQAKQAVKRAIDHAADPKHCKNFHVQGKPHVTVVMTTWPKQEKKEENIWQQVESEIIA